MTEHIKLGKILHLPAEIILNLMVQIYWFSVSTNLTWIVVITRFTENTGSSG